MTVLKVEPGGTCAVKARLRSVLLATARIAPSLIRMATRALRWLTPPSAASAARCTLLSNVVLSGWPVLPPARRAARSPGSVPSGALRAETTFTPPEPRSRWSYFCCSPPRPTWSVGQVDTRVGVHDLLGHRARPSRACAEPKVAALGQHPLLLVEAHAAQRLQLRPRSVS